MITPEPWRNKPVVTEHVQFTGFENGGNGYELLDWLHDLGVLADRVDDTLRIRTPEREEAQAWRGDWIIRGTREEIYPIRADVHADKYERA